MDNLLYILSPVLEITTLIAFFAAIGIFFMLINKMFPKTITRIKTKTGWMEWDFEDEIEDPYRGFRVHPSNYMKSTH